MTESNVAMNDATARNDGSAAAHHLAMDARSVADEPEHDIVCYCGLYETCPTWNQMNDEERRACSSDKRMTAEYYWKYGVSGA